MSLPENFRPMLSAKAPKDLSKINYPVLVSPKLDGIRCIIKDGVAVSRSLKPIPNEFVQAQLAGLPDGLDGELMLRQGECFSNVTSGIMSRKGEPDFVFHVFDWAPDGSVGFAVDFVYRLASLNSSEAVLLHPRVRVLNCLRAKDAISLLEINEDWLAQGYEGTMIRDPKAPYKFGRSTTREGGLMKLKNFADEEATIIGLEEQMHNANEATVNELGLTERSTHKANKVGKDTLGKFVCQFDDGTVFRCGGGPGLTHALRKELWLQHLDRNSPGVVGLRATIRYQPDVKDGVHRHMEGDGKSPRIPQFHGFRHEDDA